MHSERGPGRVHDAAKRACREMIGRPSTQIVESEADRCRQGFTTSLRALDNTSAQASQSTWESPRSTRLAQSGGTTHGPLQRAQSTMQYFMRVRS